MPSNYLIISFCVNVDRAACRWPALSQKVYFTYRAEMTTWHDHFTNTGTGKVYSPTVCRACVVVVLGVERACGLGIARAVVATLPARGGGDGGVQALGRAVWSDCALRAALVRPARYAGHENFSRCQPVAERRSHATAPSTTNIPDATTPQLG